MRTYHDFSDMDSLFAQADAIRPISKRRKTDKDESGKKASTSKSADTDDNTVKSISVHTKLPKSLRTASPPPGSVPKYSHIPNKKLRSQLTRQAAQSARSKALVKDAELLLTEEAGTIEVEGELEKTWRVGQSEIAKSAGDEAARGRKEWTLEGGPYRSRYTRNGRCVLDPFIHRRWAHSLTSKDIWQLSGRVEMWLLLTGRQAHFTLNCSLGRHVGT